MATITNASPFKSHETHRAKDSATLITTIGVASGEATCNCARQREHGNEALRAAGINTGWRLTPHIGHVILDPATKVAPKSS